MKVMYRGVRLRESSVDWVRKNGMEYYWKEPEQAINHVFNAIEHFKIMKILVRNGMLKCRILEGAKLGRLQIYGSEEKYLAESYARRTPELIDITLENGLIDKDRIIEYLDNRYGLPHVVTFCIDAEPTYSTEINKICGHFIPPEFITDIEPVDMTKEDPLYTQSRLKVGQI